MFRGENVALPCRLVIGRRGPVLHAVYHAGLVESKLTLFHPFPPSHGPPTSAIIFDLSSKIELNRLSVDRSPPATAATILLGFPTDPSTPGDGYGVYANTSRWPSYDPPALVRSRSRVRTGSAAFPRKNRRPFDPAVGRRSPASVGGD